MEKKWGKPELTVLLRGKPEEVLTSDCKTTGVNSEVHPNVDFQGCGSHAGDKNCGACQGRGGGPS